MANKLTLKYVFFEILPWTQTAAGISNKPLPWEDQDRQKHVASFAIAVCLKQIQIIILVK